MREPLLEEIDATARAYAEGDGDARIVMKMNSLVDPQMIKGLYRASQTGVPIALNVRGICCLVPGVPGISESISVVSVVGRFLEHSRVYAFHRHGESRYYIGSADLMPRNLDTRVELLTPITAPELKSELADTLQRCLDDDTYAWTMDSERGWTRRSGRTRSVHNELMERTLRQLDQSAG
jgi:polyphosphate kinase